LVAVVAILASVAGIGNGFAHDDVLIILGDPRIHSGDGLANVFQSAYWPPPFRPDLYRPLTTVGLAIEYALGHGSPLFFRCVSYMLYTLASVAVYCLGRRLLRPPFAACAAVLFAAHPVHVEAVALGVNQNELVIGIIACSMAAFYIDQRRYRTLRRRDWGLLVAMYIVAILLKESGYTLIAILVLCELFIIDQQSLSNRFASTWRGYTALLVVAIVLLAIRHGVLGTLAGTFSAEALVNAGLGSRLLTLLQVIPEWARLLTWPVHLRADYSPNEFNASTRFGVHEAIGTSLVLLASLAVWRTRRRTAVIAFGLSWSAVALFPVSNIVFVSGVLIAERTLFLPSIGWLIAIAALIERISQWKWSGQSIFPKLLVTVVGALTAVGLLRSARRQRVWRNDGVLWLTSAIDASRSFRVQYALGDVLFDIGQSGSAIAAYRKAIAAAPNPSPIRNDLARRLRAIGDDESALGELQSSLKAHPDQPDAEAELISALIALGRYDEARHLAQKATARWGKATLFSGLARVADSAAAIHAAPGSIRLRIRTPADLVRTR
jgi:tetratricopeptide (TPR) repeat protein